MEENYIKDKVYEIVCSLEELYTFYRLSKNRRRADIMQRCANMLLKDHPDLITRSIVDKRKKLEEDINIYASESVSKTEPRTG